jgi:hypothetical protein
LSAGWSGDLEVPGRGAIGRRVAARMGEKGGREEREKGGKEEWRLGEPGEVAAVLHGPLVGFRVSV